jgi:hypothetical protein
MSAGARPETSWRKISNSRVDSSFSGSSVPEKRETATVCAISGLRKIRPAATS